MSKFTDDEPALATAGAGAVVFYVAGLLVTHGVLSGTQASALTQQVVPIVAAAITLLLGIAARHFVVPAEKVKALLESSGLMSDADFGRVEAIVTDALLSHFQPQTGSTAGPALDTVPAAPPV